VRLTAWRCEATIEEDRLYCRENGADVLRLDGGGNADDPGRTLAAGAGFSAVRQKSPWAHASMPNLLGSQSASALDPDAICKGVIVDLQDLGTSREMQRRSAEELMPLCDRAFDCVAAARTRQAAGSRRRASELLKAVLGAMKVKDARCRLRLSRCVLMLLQTAEATLGIPESVVRAAYLDVAKVLFKYSQREGHDGDFLAERLLEPLLELLQSEAPECASSDLRVYVVGVLKNVSYVEANQKLLAQQGGIDALFKLMRPEILVGSSKETRLLIQVTYTLRNFTGQHYKQFLREDRLNALTKVMALFPRHDELLTNVARIQWKLTVNSSACDALARDDVHVRQIVDTLRVNMDSTALVLRLSFVLGNLTEKNDRLRVAFALDMEGSALVAELLDRYWQKDKRRKSATSREERSDGPGEEEEVLLKLVRLLANVAINPSVGVAIASSSAAVDPLLDILGSKRIEESEELVLNVVAALTNLLFHDSPSNVLYENENKQLLCRLFRPLLLESYNVEALIETARALGNLSRHADARRFMATLRLDEILTILLDHDDSDLVFFACGALVNFGADPCCTTRLVGVCSLAKKVGRLLGDVPPEFSALRFVAVKLLTNLSLDPNVSWAPEDVESICGTLSETIANGDAEPRDVVREGVTEQQQALELSRSLVDRLRQYCDPQVCERGLGPELAGCADTRVAAC